MTAYMQLRHTDRERLLDHVAALEAQDASVRADAALAATRLLREKGLSWRALLGADEEEPTTEPVPVHWRSQVKELLTSQAITPAERAFLGKMQAWRLPGADGLARLREIEARVQSAAEAA